MLLKAKSLCKRHLQNNFIIYFILALAFVVGIIAGSILANRLEKDRSIELANYMNVFLKHINNGNHYFKNIFLSSLWLNYKKTFIIWCLGLIAIGLFVIPLVMCWSGVNIGFIVAYLVKNFGFKGFLFTLIALLPHYLIILPGLLAIAAIALSNSIDRKRFRRAKDFSKNLLDYSILILAFSILLALGSIIEGVYTQYFIRFIGI